MGSTSNMTMCGWVFYWQHEKSLTIKGVTLLYCLHIIVSANETSKKLSDHYPTNQRSNYFWLNICNLQLLYLPAMNVQSRSRKSVSFGQNLLCPIVNCMKQHLVVLDKHQSKVWTCSDSSLIGNFCAISFWIIFHLNITAHHCWSEAASSDNIFSRVIPRIVCIVLLSTWALWPRVRPELAPTLSSCSAQRHMLG